MRRLAWGLARVGAIAALGSIGLAVVLLVPAAVLDRGPSGEPRASLFPMALAVWDPFVWACARNSLLVAAIVSAGSLVLGVALAWAVAARRFWGRPPLAALAWVPLAATPFLAAVGLKGLFPPDEVGRRLAAMTGRALVLDVPWAVWIDWAFLVWTGLAWGAPLVALSVKAALRRVDPAWADAGRALGASPRRARRQLVWPIIRPEAARTLAAVFAATLLEPGAPIVLGLRRTLPYAIVEAATRGVEADRAASLAMIALTLALLGRFLIRAWGGARADSGPIRGIERRPSVPWWRAIVLILGLAGWLAFALAPIGGLVAIALGGAVGSGGRGWVVALATVVYDLLDPDTARIWGNSLLLGLTATLLAAGLVAAIRRGRMGVSRPSLLVLAIERTPPLVLGVALALLPGQLALLGSLGRAGGLRRLGAWLDPMLWPGLLLIAASAATRLPMLARASDRADHRARPELADAAQALGGSRRRAIALGGGRGPGPGVLFLSFALAATASAPAVVLTPSTRTRPVGPGIVGIADDEPRAAALALGAFGLNLVGLLAARRTRSGAAGDWFRG